MSSSMSAAAQARAAAQAEADAEFESETAERNPFALPSDEEVFRMRDEERKRKKEERARMASLKVWQKGAPAHARASSLKFSRKSKKKGGPDGGGGAGGDELGADAGESVAPTGHGAAARSLVAAATAAISTDRRRDKENMAEFVAKKREMFLVQMSLDTKREEIRKLEEKAQTKEEALKKSELMLEEDAIRFDTFLKENDKKAHDAIKRAEKETKLKAEKVSEIKKLNGQIQLVQSDMAKQQETLEDCLQYKRFLDGLTPPEYFEARRAEKRARQKARLEKRIAARLAAWEEEKAAVLAAAAAKEAAEAAALAKAGKVRRKKDAAGARAKPPALPPRPNVEEEEALTSSGEELPMYFTKPSQLLEIFTQLEEQNLFLIQNSQETEQALEELRAQYRDTKKKMEHKTAHIAAGITELRADIDAEDARAATMRLRSSAAHGGGHGGGDDSGGGGGAAAGPKKGGGGSGGGGGVGAEGETPPLAPTNAQEDLLTSLHGKVADVYGRVCATTGSDPSTLSMLKELESKLEDLLFAIGHMPEKYVVAMEKLKEKERRERVRQERMLEAQRTYEDRMAKSMARSMQAPKKRRGRQVMWRSRPLRKNVQLDKVEDEEDEDAKYLE